MSWIGKKAADVVTSGQQLANGTVTAIKLAAGAVISHLGYTPANKAGDVFSSDIEVNGTNKRIKVVDGSKYIGLGQWDGSTNRIESVGADMLAIQYGSTQKMRFQHASVGDFLVGDSAGRVTMPFQPAFLAYSSTNGTVTVANETRITMFDSTKFNIGSCFSASRFTAPVAGLYHFYAHMDVNKSDGQYTVLNFRVNGGNVNGADSMVGAAFNGGAATNPCIVLLTLKLSANDYVDIYNRNIGTSFYSGHCHWGGYLVG
jgi:hypothetical protein